MKQILVVFVALISSLLVRSQTVTHDGMVVNENLLDVNYFITLKNLKDSITYSEVTDVNNRFEFKDIPVGTYQRCVSWFEQMQCDTILLDADLKDDVIYIFKQNIIDGVEINIIKKRPLIQNKYGTLVVNVEDNPIMNTSSVFDAVVKSPGVSYNLLNNSFTLKGKSGVVIQLDGETILLSGSEMIQYLKSIPAQDVKNIEINTTPSSKHDAGGGIGGIINIVRKSNKREGYFASVSLNATQGKYYRQNSNLKLQYNKKKSQYMFQYTNSFDTDFEKAVSEKQFSNVSSNQDTYAKVMGNTNTLNFSYLQEFKRSKLLLSAIGSFYSEDINQDTNLFFTNKQSSIVESMVYSNQDSYNKLRNANLNLKYEIDFDKSKLIFRSYYLNYDINNSSSLVSLSNVDNSVYLDNKSSKMVDLFVSQIDYSVVVDSISSLEVGVKGIFQNLQNTNNYYDLGSGIPVFDSQRSNDFEYSESILSGYTEYKRKVSKFDFVLGGRVEYNPSEGHNVKNNYTLKRNQLYFFPFLNVSYEYSENSFYYLSYNKRIVRPSFSQLMPFDYYLDSYTILSGNPHLSPHLAHGIDFQYLLKQRYVFGINYTFDKNQIFQTPVLNNTSNTTVLKPLNIKEGHSISLFSNSNFTLFKKINLNLNTVAFYNKIRSIQDDVKVNSEDFSYQITLNGSYDFFKDYTFNLVFDYISPYIQGPYKTEEIVNLSASVSKSFFQDKLRVALIANDILGTYKINNHLNNDLQNVYVKQLFDTRWIRLNLTYSFDRGLKKENIKQDGTVDDIKQRVN